MKRALVLVTMAAVTLLLGAACGGDDSNGEAATTTTSDVTTTSSDAGSGANGGGGGSAAIDGELGRYTTEQGLTRVYLLVEPNISDDELIDLARSVHEADPEVSTFFFMDDDSRIDDVLAALPETEQGDRSNWPAEWVTDHTAAALAMYLYPEPPTRRWVLGRGLSPDPEDALVVLE